MKTEIWVHKQGHGVAEMQREGEDGRTPDRRFADIFRAFVDFRGPDAEAALYRDYGRDRIQALYAGDEPSFGEFLDLTQRLAVPLSVFASLQTGDTPAINLVVSEILYYSASMEPAKREVLAEALLTVLVSHAGLDPDEVSVLGLLEKSQDG